MTRSSKRSALIALAWTAAAFGALLAVVLPPASRKLNMARRYARETAAIHTLRTIHAAQSRYRSRFGHFAASLPELEAFASNLIPADVAAGESESYKFTLTGTHSGYAITAVPDVFGSAGSRGDPATANSKAVGSAAAEGGESAK